MAFLEDHEQGTWGEAGQGARRVWRGLALPCSCRHTHNYLLPQQANQLARGLKSMVRSEWPLSLRPVAWQSPALGPVTPSRAAGGSTALERGRERLDSAEQPGAPGTCICKVPNRWVHLLEHVPCAHTEPSPEAHAQRC